MIRIKENISLKPFNTFGIDAGVRYLVTIENVNDINDFLRSPLAEVKPFFVLGEGSNILFTKDFQGVILHPEIKGTEITERTDSNVWIKAAAGENWDSFVRYCVENGFGGIENLSFIPGSIGASPVQNIGAYGVEVKDVIEQVEAVERKSGNRVILTNQECRFGYRDSVFKNEKKDQLIITHVVFRLSLRHRLITHYGNIENELRNYPGKTIADIREIIIKIRKEKLPDPAEIGNAGSFFKNPVVEEKMAGSIFKDFPKMPFWKNGDKIKLSAAWLIEQCGLKGKKINHAGTFEKQPLILVNYGGSTGKELIHFAGEIQQAVFAKFGIRLETEVNIL